jgi:hypothetical protein
MSEGQNTEDISYALYLKINKKLQKEAMLFHKISDGKSFTKEDVVAYAKSQVQTKEDELKLFEALRKDYVTRDFMPDVHKIRAFDNIISGAQDNIDFYSQMAKEFEKK